jgi:predicted MFS family arabinose efflux permease
MLAFALVFQSIPPVLTLIREELNITYAQAGLLMSLFALPGIFIAIPSGIICMHGSLFLSPLIGYFVYRFGKEEAFIVVAGIALTFLIFLVPTTSLHLPLLVLMGIFTAFVPAPVFSLPSKIVKPQSLGLGFGILTACLNVGVLAGSYLTGLAKDFAGEYTTSFYLMSVFTIMQTATILLLHQFKSKKTNA